MIVPIEQALQEFLLACRESLSPKTIRWYEDHLRDLVESLKGTPIDQIPTLPIRQHLVAFREAPTHRRGKNILPGPVSLETLRGRHRALKRFFNWCVMEYDLEYRNNPMRKIPTPPTKQQPPKAISMEDVRLMLDATDDSPIGIRDRLIIMFLLDTGCRAGGLLGLKPHNLLIDDLRAIVVEKGDRARVVPFSPQVAYLFRQWFAVRPENAEYVFCRFGNVPSEVGKQMTLNALHQLLRRLAKKAGVKGRFNAHSFRHANAREFLRNGGNMASLQQLLGHTTPDVTMRFYARFDVGELAQQHAQYSPLNSLNKERG